MKKVKAEAVQTAAPEVEVIQKKINDASSEINAILVKYGIEFVVVHKMTTNADLKQEEIVHEIVMRPRK